MDITHYCIYMDHIHNYFPYVYGSRYIYIPYRNGLEIWCCPSAVL